MDYVRYYTMNTNYRSYQHLQVIWNYEDENVSGWTIYMVKIQYLKYLINISLERLELLNTYEK